MLVKTNSQVAAWGLMLGVGALAGCQSDATRSDAPDAAAVVTQYATLVHANYEDALQGATHFQADLNAFLAEPTESGWAGLKESWIAMRRPYLQTEAFRFYGGPIDDEDGPEPRINAWPIDENYIDYVDGAPDAGIINQVASYPEITQALLAELNEKDGEKNISTGFHAIEFLLWGQDFNEAGPGERPVEDYMGGQHAARRGQYLRVTTDLLVEDLKAMEAAWAPGQPNNERAAFEKNPEESLRRLLVGIGTLSGAELAGERMTVPYQTRDQEDEHSCFSDTTDQDIVLNAVGIRNVYLGSYTRPDGTRVEGPGFDALVRARDPALADALTQQINASVAAAEAIPVPFDQAIIDPAGRAKVKATIDSLKQQAALLAQAAERLGIALNLGL